MNYVVGSGPSGMACAWALVNRGLDVTMLDIGDELPADGQRAVERTRQSPPDAWDADELRLIRGSMAATTRGVLKKQSYGSEFAYGDGERDTRIESHGVDASASVARGGFSNVWGAAVLPVASTDIADWPITVADLAPHYEAVLAMMPLAATTDDLADLWPLYTRDTQALRPSAQARALFHDLAGSRETLKGRGFAFGAARLAVAPRTPSATSGCVYCGLCLSGCPYGLIYKSSLTLRDLMERPGFHYASGVIVRKVREANGGVEIDADARAGGPTQRFSGARVFLGAGALSTTKIVLDSLDARGHGLVMKQSQYFAFPWLRYRRTPAVADERLHTLAQAFIEVMDASLTGRTIHLQVYSYNDLYWSAFGPVARSATARRLLDSIMSRLLYVQGYLHSDISPTIAVRLVADGRHTRLRLDAMPEPHAAETIKKLVSKIAASRRDFRAVPLRPWLMVGRPGSGSHVGGTIPMRHAPGQFESDPLGRPTGFTRVHVIDSTGLPSLPATTQTLTVMANAHRIGMTA